MNYLVLQPVVNITGCPFNVSAMSVMYFTQTDLLVRYRDDKKNCMELDDDCRRAFHRFKLQLIDDTVFSLDASSHDASRNSVSCILRGMVRPLPLTNVSSGVNPEGLLLYNGHLFKAAVNEADTLIVATLDYPIKREGSQWFVKYDIHQDDRISRYGLAYFKDSGLLIYMIDLLKHTVTKTQSYMELGFVGLSKENREYICTLRIIRFPA